MNESDTTQADSAEADSASTESEVSLSTVVDKAMELLARREHSRVELREKLVRRSYPSELVDAVLDDFAERNLQSDERFAEVYVRSRLARGYGELKIRSELQTRGIAGNIVLLALEASDANWYRNAEVALEKKFASRLTPEDVRTQKIRGKMQRFLQNRGYNPDQIISAVSRITALVDANADESAGAGLEHSTE